MCAWLACEACASMLKLLSREHAFCVRPDSSYRAYAQGEGMGRWDEERMRVERGACLQLRGKWTVCREAEGTCEVVPAGAGAGVTGGPDMGLVSPRAIRM